MSKSRIQLSAIIDTEAHADTIVSSIRQQLQGKDIFQEHNLARGLNERSQVELGFDFRFNNDVDRDALKDWVRDQLENHPTVKTWVQSAKLLWHRCTHDDSVVMDCKTTDFFEWSR